MINKLFKNKDIKVIILEVFLIVLGLVGLTLGVKYIMNSINVNIDTSKLAIDSMNANVTNGTLTPINDSTVNINTTSNVLRITFDVKGASTNTGSNIIYDVLLNLTADCTLKNESVKWNLYKNNNLLTSGSTSPKYDKDVLNGKIMLTDTQQDLVPYSKTADKYVFILWMSESCNEEDITKCDISKGLTSDSGGKSISGNIDIRLNSGKKKENKRETANITNVCKETKATYIVEHIDDGSTGDSGSGVYKVSHDAIPAESSATGKEIPAVIDYRYYGASPNNYICLDMEGQNTCPEKNLFRIIGSIYDELSEEYKLKIIKNQYLTDGKTSIFNWLTEGENKWKWAEITESNGKGSKEIFKYGYGASRILNEIWWNKQSKEVRLFYFESDTLSLIEIADNKLDFSNTGLNSNVKDLIDEGRYYLGNISNLALSANEYYKQERGIIRTRSDAALYWDGFVALMYPSDFYYAAGNNCVKNYNGTGDYTTPCVDYNWLTIHNKYNLTSPFEGYNTKLFLPVFESELFITTMNKKNDDSSPEILYKYYIEESSKKENMTSEDYNNQFASAIRPVFYLKSKVVITTGDGSKQNPYQISLS